ncbi:MAG: dethiobiotin synthase [Candidatus Omnitrophica bacterium]|nr:dethiobiotin synthase [Candidatus Omnitrophota bacterium]MDD5488878.1 dethiobiotin synthase [Candidatus Omnitrophota bacterium]
MSRILLVTGTDTDVGKTVVTALLNKYLNECGVMSVTQKWVQTGSKSGHDDISRHMGSVHDGERTLAGYRGLMVPYTLAHAASPHLAAVLEGVEINAATIIENSRELSRHFDVVLSEGAGGLMVPVNADVTILDIAEILGADVLVVAANRLGCINHTLLTINELKRRSVGIVGVVFNRTSPEGDEIVLRDNPKMISRMSGVEVIGELPFFLDEGTLYEAFRPIGVRVLEILKKGDRNGK